MRSVLTLAALAFAFHYVDAARVLFEHVTAALP